MITVVWITQNSHPIESKTNICDFEILLRIRFKCFSKLATDRGRYVMKEEGEERDALTILVSEIRERVFRVFLTIYYR